MAKKNKGLSPFRIILITLVCIAALAAYRIFGSNVRSASSGNDFYLFIPTGANYDDVKKLLTDGDHLVEPFSFDLLSKMAKYTGHVRPGRYHLTNGMSNYTLIRMLRSGRQEAVKLVINKLRTKKDLAEFVSAQLEASEDSILAILDDTAFLSQYGLDTNTAMCLVVPDTYEFYWNTNARKFFSKVAANYKNYWNETRLQKAAAKNITKEQAIIIASIVEEETNMEADKGNITSVYLNRLHIGMPLQADPTLKFAVGDFTIKRITGELMQVVSPYNTYKNKGLPPGPICIPSKTTIDAVLNAPDTKYLYFCARPDFSGYSVFASNMMEHMVNARAYQKALNERGIH